MTRYFFPASRAHHAYCMARDFGMEFERRFGKWDPEGLLHIDPASSYRIYVHPDSLHLLEPHPDDVIEIYDPRTSVPKVPGTVKRVRGVNYADFLFNVKETDGRIIQRNGIPFHWPEVEP